MAYTHFIGIDPGIAGAIAVLDLEGKLVAHYKFPVLIFAKKKQINIAELHAWLISNKFFAPLATVERVHAMPKQGVTSSFTFGMGFGVLQGLLVALEIPYCLVEPKRWKGDIMADSAKDKDASVAIALRLFPQTREILIGPKGGRDHNIADALLISEWSRRKFGKPV